MKTTETVTLPLFFVPLFIWCGGAFFNNVLVQKCNVGVYAVFISFQCFVCTVIFRCVIFVCWLCRYICDFVSFVKIFNMQLQGVLGILRQRFVQKCNVGVSLQFSSIFNVFCAVIFRRVFCLLVVQLLLDFVFCVKIFNMQLQGVLGIFQQRFVQKCNVGVCAVFINCQCFVCAVIFHRVIFVCWLCSCSCDFVFHRSFVFLYVNCRGGCRK